MSLATVVPQVASPSVREQIERAELLHSQRTPEELRRRHEVLARTHGALSKEDGEIFEQAMLDARRFETPG